MSSLIRRIYAGAAKPDAGGGGGGSTKYGASIDNIFGDINSSGVLQVPSAETELVFTGVKGLPSDVFNSFFQSLPITAIKFPDLTSFGNAYTMYKAFYKNNKITSAEFPELVTISGPAVLQSAFEQASNLASVTFPKLKEITSASSLNGAFKQTKLTSVSFTNLDTVTGSYCMSSCFEGTTTLTSLSFPALKSDSFGSYTNQFGYMLYGITGCTVHFPSNLQSVIGSWSDVTGGFGGTNTTVSYDLEATE